jgi:hypothetical protein
VSRLLAGGRSRRPDVFRLGGLGHFYSLSNIHGPKFASLFVDIQQFHHHSILRVTINNLARGFPNVLRDGNHHTEHSIALVARPQQVIYPFQVSGLISPFRQIGSPIGIIGDRFSGVIQYVLPQCHDDSTAVRRAGRRAPSLAFTSRAEMRESLRQTSHDRPRCIGRPRCLAQAYEFEAGVKGAEFQTETLPAIEPRRKPPGLPPQFPKMPQLSRSMPAARLCPAGSCRAAWKMVRSGDTSRNISDKWFERPGVRD